MIAAGWRPEGWTNPFGIIIQNNPDEKGLFLAEIIGDKSYEELKENFKVFEAGADAMLKALLDNLYLTYEELGVNDK